MEQNPDLKQVVQTFWKERKRIAVITGIATITTAIISLLMPNYYKATTVYYVSSADMATVEHFYGRAKKDLEYFGNDADIDRMFSVAKSNELFQFLIDSFSLAEHYNISLKKPKDGFKLYKKVDKHFNVIKNKFNAIELSFEDKDPEFAAKVANAARDKIDELVLRLVREKQWAHIQSFTENLRLKENNFNLIADTLDSLRSFYNIVNLSTQAEAISALISEVESGYIRESAKLEAIKDSRNVKRDTIEMIAATVQGLERELNSLKGKGSDNTYSLSRFNEGRRQIEMVEARYYISKEHIGYDSERLKQLISAYNAKIPMLMVLESAQVPLVKYRPVRSMYVLASLLCSFFGAGLFFVFRSSLKTFSLES
jgi:tyrosine-protein kinase Etk/Wzc